MDRTGDFQSIRASDYANGRIAWALQPHPAPMASEEELKEQRAWKVDVLAIIDRRIALFESPAKPRARLASKDIVAGYTGTAGRRVAGIAELLEAILRHTDIGTNLVAMDVCKSWRDIAVYIMKLSTTLDDFTLAYPCPPVKFGDVVDGNLRWLEATEAEFEFLNEELVINLGWTRLGVYRGVDRFNDPNMSNIIETVCYPGRITQASNAPPDQLYAAEFFYHEQLLWNGIERPLADPQTRKWVDVTQFKFNPCFTALFPGSFKVVNGLAEVTLQPSCLNDAGIGWHNLPKTAMKYLNSQFLTQPPIISLNVSTWIPQLDEPRPRKALHIVNVKNEKGIKVSEILSAMTSASNLAIEHWCYWAKQLRTAVEVSHWDQDVWIVDGAPKLLLSLDPFASGEEHARSLFYLSCMHALPGRDERQAEWIPRTMFRSPAVHIQQT